jgi:hypothetical protein
VTHITVTQVLLFHSFHLGVTEILAINIGKKHFLLYNASILKNYNIEYCPEIMLSVPNIQHVYTLLLRYVSVEMLKKRGSYYLTPVFSFFA